MVRAKGKEPSSTGTAPAAALAKEVHKYFDHAVVSFHAGDSGHGAVLAMPLAPSTDAPKSGTLCSRMHTSFAGETLRLPIPVDTVVNSY